MDTGFSKYIHNYVSIKRYGDDYKLSCLKFPIRRKGFEYNSSALKEKRERCSNENKLSNNISRAKSKVMEYALCNDFDYFVTLTIDGKKYNREDLKLYYKDLSKFLNNYNTNHKTKIKYILIPELHKDGKSWHMHGLISGIKEKHLVANKNNYLDWKQYSKKFGYMSLGVIKDKKAVSRYITKYINKDMGNSISELNAHSYYCSKGLKTAEKVKEGILSANNIPYDFENEYVGIKWLIKSELDSYNDLII